MPWAVAAAAVGAAGSIYSANKSASAAEKAGERSEDAALRAIELGQEAFETSEEQLAPYMSQELAASNQLMAQMGLQAPRGGWGADMGVGGPDDDSMDKFLFDLMENETAIALRAGYRGKHGVKGVNEGARRAIRRLEQLQDQGKIPADYELPSLEELQGVGWEALKYHGGHKGLRRNSSVSGTEDYNDILGMASEYFNPESGLSYTQEEWEAEQDALMAEGGEGAGGPMGAMGAQDILELQGLETLDPELRAQYIEELKQDPRTDPALAEYLGLTEESMQVGDSYQDTDAYRKAIEAGAMAVNQNAAGSGSLYSGSRGRALRDVGQEVEQGYYMDAMDRREAMMAARRGERAAGIARRGLEVESGRSREQSAYNNYMNMLMQLSQPTTTTNVASMRQNAASGQGSQLIQGANTAGAMNVSAANAQAGAIADVSSGIMQMGSAYLDSRN